MAECDCPRICFAKFQWAPIGWWEPECVLVLTPDWLRSIKTTRLAKYLIYNCLKIWLDENWDWVWCDPEFWLDERSDWLLTVVAQDAIMMSECCCFWQSKRLIGWEKHEQRSCWLNVCVSSQLRILLAKFQSFQPFQKPIRREVPQFMSLMRPDWMSSVLECHDPRIWLAKSVYLCLLWSQNWVGWLNARVYGHLRIWLDGKCQNLGLSWDRNGEEAWLNVMIQGSSWLSHCVYGWLRIWLVDFHSDLRTWLSSAGVCKRVKIPGDPSDQPGIPWCQFLALASSAKCLTENRWQQQL